ncbi:MAG: hypothetical protein U9R05_03850 [Chloroflexota bacterium]|nr:hypothetical protein [Chloroflexota bacterium]
MQHQEFPDPASATGSESHRLEVFRQVRDAIRQRVLTYLEEMLLLKRDRPA